MITRWAAAIALLSTAGWTPALRADDPSTEQAPGPSSAAPQETTGLVTKDLSVTVGKSLVVLNAAITMRWLRIARRS